jgi:hypothetical protein
MKDPMLIEVASKNEEIRKRINTTLCNLMKSRGIKTKAKNKMEASIPDIIIIMKKPLLNFKSNVEKRKIKDIVVKISETLP